MHIIRPKTPKMLIALKRALEKLFLGIEKWVQQINTSMMKALNTVLLNRVIPPFKDAAGGEADKIRYFFGAIS